MTPYAAPVLLAALAIGACDTPAGPILSPDPDRPSAAASASGSAGPAEPGSILLSLDHAAWDACRGQVVDFAGDLRVHVVARTVPGGFVVRWAAQGTGLTGEGRSTGATYRLVGAVQEELTVDHRQRVVTVADFRAVVTGEPGVSVGRASAAPRFGVALAFEATANGLLAPELEGVLSPQTCGGGGGG